MIPSSSENLTSQFYKWEHFGRGWYVYGQPVQLEPPFAPLLQIPVSPDLAIDDGREPTLLSSIADMFRSKSTQVQNEDTDLSDISIDRSAFPSEDMYTLSEIQINVPKGQDTSIDTAESFLVMLSNCRLPICYEVISTHDKTVIQITCRQPDESYVLNQVKAFYPEVVLTIEQGYLIKKYQEYDGFQEMLIVDFGLSDEFMCPLQSVRGFNPDLLSSIAGALEGIESGEMGAIQVLFQGVKNPWAKEMLHAVQDDSGGCFFSDAPEILSLTREKVASPLFSVVIRVLAQSESNERSLEIVQSVAGVLKLLSRPSSNELIALSNDKYPYDAHLFGVLHRNSHRLGMILNSKELVSLVHLPSASVVSEKLGRDLGKTKKAPDAVCNNEYVLGVNLHHSKETEVGLSAEQKLRHIHVIGATGMGKSVFLLNQIIQDIEKGNGIAVLDPHGDLIDNVLSHIPDHRHKDVVLVDPSDYDYPVGFNLLTAHSEIEKIVLSSDLIALFQRIATSWGDVMTSVLSNAISAFLESDKGGTLLDLRRFLVEQKFRDTFMKTVRDPSVVYYWENEFPHLKSHSIAPLLTRLNTFLRPKLIRNMMAQKEGLDFNSILDGGKILLVKLSQGLIGSENSYLLGTLIVSKLHQAVMARQAKSDASRNNYFLYVDEFQNFITKSMEDILSGARKYHFGLVAAHQNLDQIQKQDSEVANSIISNAGTRICFRLGDFDAKKLEDGFSYFSSSDLQNLNIGEAIVRVDKRDSDFNLVTVLPDKVDKNIASERKANIIRLSRDKYGENRENIEKGIADNLVSHIHPISEKEEPQAIVEQPVADDKPSIERDEIQKVESERKGITEHRYLQTYVKKLAESRGFKATIEQEVPHGKGRVDVALELGEIRIACEISVTTKEYEIKNIEKCLTAGYKIVVVCSSGEHHANSLKEFLYSNLTPSVQSMVKVFTKGQLAFFLDQQIAQIASIEKRTKGYRVKSKYNAIPESEMDKKRDSVSKVILDAMKRKKKSERNK
ncbi:hypothetical protein COB64_03820 [Candidatus Wolfebacteria bacterium]|nr:MAG: hypothetical protein COB64_03820 [Candidatus Wolfebacteria bacterium]